MADLSEKKYKSSRDTKGNPGSGTLSSHWGPSLAVEHLRDINNVVDLYRFGEMTYSTRHGSHLGQSGWWRILCHCQQPCCPMGRAW